MLSGRLRKLLGERCGVRHHGVRVHDRCAAGTSIRSVCTLLTKIERAWRGAGLSTLELRRRFPEARSLTGVDLSPHFLAVARVTQRRRGAAPFAVPDLCWCMRRARWRGLASFCFSCLQRS